jgi:DnaJ-class molecular chaperone
VPRHRHQSRQEAPLSLEFVILTIAIMVIIVVVFSRINVGPKVRCNRCDGSGSVNERWPDPTQPGGWHVVEGICPKCKGKGRLSSGR